jgi:hypothetical protein
MIIMDPDSLEDNVIQAAAPHICRLLSVTGDLQHPNSYTYASRCLVSH